MFLHILDETLFSLKQNYKASAIKCHKICRNDIQYKPISANLIRAKYVEYGLDERYLVLFAYIVMQMYTYLSGFYFNKNTL